MYTENPQRDWAIVICLAVIAIFALLAILTQNAGGPRVVLEGAKQWFEFNLVFH